MLAGLAGEEVMEAQRVSSPDKPDRLPTGYARYNASPVHSSGESATSTMRSLSRRSEEERYRLNPVTPAHDNGWFSRTAPTFFKRSDRGGTGSCPRTGSIFGDDLNAGHASTSTVNTLRRRSPSNKRAGTRDTPSDSRDGSIFGEEGGNDCSRHEAPHSVFVARGGGRYREGNHRPTVPCPND